MNYLYKTKVRVTGTPENHLSCLRTALNHLANEDIINLKWAPYSTEDFVNAELIKDPTQKIAA